MRKLRLDTFGRNHNQHRHRNQDDLRGIVLAAIARIPLSRLNSTGMFKTFAKPYIKPGSPHLNGKVERSHRTHEREFYQLLTYTNDVDLRARLPE